MWGGRRPGDSGLGRHGHQWRGVRIGSPFGARRFSPVRAWPGDLENTHSTHTAWQSTALRYLFTRSPFYRPFLALALAVLSLSPSLTSSKSPELREKEGDRGKQDSSQSKIPPPKSTRHALARHTPKSVLLHTSLTAEVEDSDRRQDAVQ